VAYDKRACGRLKIRKAYEARWMATVASRYEENRQRWLAEVAAKVNALSYDGMRTVMQVMQRAGDGTAES
jgi:hypothetical protein